ncbi:MAG TPA: hypothetical protein VFO44_09265, partial [Steroidobacteraceae bacterium]|nr:hypothetical protein [Steroidobacteraceae bacterium]
CTGASRADSLVYVGDAGWDARACRDLMVPFVGIAADAHAQHLVAEGAVAVFPDYSDIPEFCSALSRARQWFIERSTSPEQGGTQPL